MNILVVGATGMTGRLVVEQLLDNGHKVRIIARSPKKLSVQLLDNPKLTLIEASVLDITNAELTEHTKNCDAVVSCLGHVLDLKGIYGEPKKLCTKATDRLCESIEKNKSATPVKFILMNTVGVANPELVEKRTWYDKALLTLLHHALPPHKDNETAVEHLFKNVRRDSKYIEWCGVRPDSLINAGVSSYEICPSPTTGIVSGRSTSRANVARFMVELTENNELWGQWKFKLPVIMNT
jgi:nucleoside-diphosphate-sugar epimerase